MRDEPIYGSPHPNKNSSWLGQPFLEVGAGCARQDVGVGSQGLEMT